MSIAPDFLSDARKSPSELATSASSALQPTTSAPARNPKLHDGKPRKCATCAIIFASGNAFHRHVAAGCRLTPESRKRKAAAIEPEPTSAAPETYADAITLPRAKKGRFIHRGIAGDVAAVEVDGTIFYDTAPRVPLASPHKVWRRA